ALPSYAPHTQLAPIHLDISLNFDFPNRAVDGSVVLTIKNSRSVAKDAGNSSESVVRDKSPDSITLNAMHFKNVIVRACPIPDTVRVEGLEAYRNNIEPVRFHYDGELLRVEWEYPFQPG